MIDKLIMLGPAIRPEFANLAKQKGQPSGGYAHVLDLRTSKFQLPAKLYFEGRHNGESKLELIGVARLGVSCAQQIILKIFPNLDQVRIYRIDLCVDIRGISVERLSQRCCVRGAHNTRIFKGRTGDTFYLQASHAKSVLLYDRAKRLRFGKDVLANLYSPNELVTRLEVQFRGKAVPFTRFPDIHRYSADHLLNRIDFFEMDTQAEHLLPRDQLASIGFRTLLEERGLQGTKKMFPSSAWPSIKQRYLRPARTDRRKAIGELFDKTQREWLHDRIRFPRLKIGDGRA